MIPLPNETLTPETAETGTVKNNNYQSFRLPVATYSFARGGLPAYDYSRYAHPAMAVNLTVPDSDLPKVGVWMGSTATEGTLPSETLVKRMTEGVIGGMKQYIAEASRVGLFTSPFRIGYALRRSDGTRFAFGETRLLLPNAGAPLAIVRESNLSGNSWQTMTEIVNMPCRLRVGMEGFSLPGGQRPAVTHLDFFVTRQASLFTGYESVTGIRSEEYLGERCRVWAYPRLSEQEVRQCAALDSDFRVIASIPITDAEEGLTGLELPAGRRNLNEWSDFPALTGAGSVGEGAVRPFDPDGPGLLDYDRFRLTTCALDLGNPEERKRVHGLSVRGVFERTSGKDDSSMIVRLYGSRHRERWRLLATARGPHLRPLRGVNYRWLMVEVEAGKEARPEALTMIMS